MQTQDDASNFKEENVKRDQKGRFAKHAEKMFSGAQYAGATASGTHVFTHSKSGKNGWQEISTKLKDHGYEQSNFGVLQKEHTDKGFVYQSSAHFSHPDGHKAVVLYSEGGSLGQGQGHTGVTLVYNHTPPLTSKVQAAGGPSFDKLAAAEKMRPPISTTSQHYAKKMTAILKKIDAAKASPNPAAALAALQIDKSVTPAVAYKNALLDAYQSAPVSAPAAASPAPAVTPPAPSKVPGLNQAALLDIAEKLRPKLSTTSQHYAKKVGAQLKKLDAVTKAGLTDGQIYEKLQEIKIPAGLPAVSAYHKALITAYTQPGKIPASGAPSPATPVSPASASSPAPAPTSSNPAMKHGGSATLKNGKTVVVDSMDLAPRRDALPLYVKPSGDKWDGVLPEDLYYKLAADQRTKMNSKEVAAAVNYQGGGYSDMNKYLAGVHRFNKSQLKENHTHKECEDLQKHCLANSIPRDIILQRGLDATLADLLDLPKDTKVDPNTLVGGVFVHHGFVSSSRGVGFSSKNLKLRISAKAGQPGLTMPALSQEREILLPAGSVFRITKVESYGSNQHTIHVEYEGPSNQIPPKPSP